MTDAMSVTADELRQFIERAEQLKAPVGNQCVTAGFPTAPTASLVQP